MNGNVKVYLALAIVILWAHTLFTAHELVRVPTSDSQKYCAATPRRMSLLQMRAEHAPPQ